MPGVFPEMNEIYERSGIGVRVYLETWDKLTLEQFYAACHALVYPSHGEGKNLPALEFAATGGVVLATDWSGHQEWLRDDYAYPLACTVEPMFPSNRLRALGGGGHRGGQAGHVARVHAPGRGEGQG